METMKIDEQVSVGPQPSKDDLQQLQRQGFRSIVNFRTEGEDDQPLSPDDEGAEVLDASMDYLHIPVSMKSMGPEVVDRFRETFPTLPKPVYAHCKSGKRAGAMVMMHMAVAEGMTGEQTLQKAEEMGFECDNEQLREFVKSYVDEHAKSPAS